MRPAEVCGWVSRPSDSSSASSLRTVDGDTERPLRSTSAFEPTGIAVSGGDLYWLSRGVLNSMPSGGGSSTTLATTHPTGRNVAVLFTKDRKVADSDSFTAKIRRAGGIWFEGGLQQL